MKCGFSGVAEVVRLWTQHPKVQILTNSATKIINGVAHCPTRRSRVLGLLAHPMWRGNTAARWCAQQLALGNPHFAVRHRPQGLTLIEMLVGMAITLVMMAAVVTLFANLGEGIRNRRAGMEMNGQLRVARARLFKDLSGATCPAVTWQEPGSDNGYIEIIEGRRTDKDPSGLIPFVAANVTLVPSSQLSATDGMALGDYDDILALTVRSESAPFVGRGLVWDSTANAGAGAWIDGTIQSNLAEVIWYAVENPADGSLGEPGMRTVYRRVLLIAPWVQLPAIAALGQGKYNLNLLVYYTKYDISAHDDGIGRLVPNTLGDLSKREYRFAHRLNSNASGLGWPYVMDQRAFRQATYDPTSPPAADLGPFRPYGAPFEPAINNAVPAGPFPERQGEDVMLNDVLAFDLRVFDPGAPLFQYPAATGVLVEPLSDRATFQTVIASGALAGFGAFVDLGWDESGEYNHLLYGAPEPLFQGEHRVGWHPRVPNQHRGTPAVYDTWSTHYESDGIDQDGLNGNDQGTNGLDDIDPTFADPFDQVDPADQAVNGTDDVGERETSPPYDVPLRGMQVKIRIYERDTRQIREATVTKSFSN